MSFEVLPFCGSVPTEFALPFLDELFDVFYVVAVRCLGFVIPVDSYVHCFAVFEDFILSHKQLLCPGLVSWEILKDPDVDVKLFRNSVEDEFICL